MIEKKREILRRIFHEGPHASIEAFFGIVRHRCATKKKKKENNKKQLRKKKISIYRRYLSILYCF